MPGTAPLASGAAPRFGAQQLPSRQGPGLCSPLPSRPSAALRSRGAPERFLPFPAPVFLREGRRARRSALPQPPPPAPRCPAHLPKLFVGPNPPAGPGAAPSFPDRDIPRHRRPLAQNRALCSSTGDSFWRSGPRPHLEPPALLRFLAERQPRPRRVRAPPPAPLPAGAAGLRPAGGRHRQPEEKFSLPLPKLHFIKIKRKTFPADGFRCVGEAAAAGAARGAEPAAPPPPGSVPSRPPSPLPGRMRVGGVKGVSR